MRRGTKVNYKLAVTVLALSESKDGRLAMFRIMRKRAVYAIERIAPGSTLVRIRVEKGPFFDDHEGGTFELTVVAFGVPA